MSKYPQNGTDEFILGDKYEQNITKTLGIVWNTNNDSLLYNIKSPEIEAITKRRMLSQIAAIFDPLGMISPIIIRAKLLMQEIWKSGQDWDVTLPEEIRKEWAKLTQELPTLREICIPRWIQHKKGSKMEIHAFCDASLKAYGAVVYSKTIDDSGQIHVSLLVSKSKVAPIKNKKTLPKLELCGAVLLAKLVHRTIKALDIQEIPVHAYSDSTITLAWINADAARLPAFVDNKVREIKQLIGKVKWYHVRSENNPADLITRGITASKLISHKLWWNGPDQLSQNPTNIQEMIQSSTSANALDTSKSINSLTTTTIEENPCIQDTLDILLQKFESWEKTIRVTAYCLRFSNKCQKQHNATVFLSRDELQKATLILLRKIQYNEYSSEFKDLSNDRPLSKKSSILSLNPFLDNQQLMRVGRRTSAKFSAKIRREASYHYTQ
ncbi:uncharacterized protein LOC123670826 [Harmonia axyridis]|uniref:uncharacterized protein LOC123670826 n=1 Tax=Harmonia axyridis TaxID=115357 RepID=UPI001E275740|nr:uncharacterized protein LOC123670826 [Harmonia axyridis]